VTIDKSRRTHCVALSLFIEQSLFNNVYHADMNVFLRRSYVIVL
jgi:hypothetical protein